MIKLVIFDTETTGLDSRKHAMVQLSGKILVNNQIVSSFNFKIRPFDDSEIEDEALKVNGFTLDQLAEFDAPEVALKKMKEYFYQFVDHDDPKDLLIPVAYNVKFDEGFLKSFFYKLNAFNSYKNIFSHRTIDVMGLAIAYLFRTGKISEMDRLHQSNVADALGIKYIKENLHDADEDSTICEKIFQHLQNQWKV